MFPLLMGSTKHEAQRPRVNRECKEVTHSDNCSKLCFRAAESVTITLAWQLKISALSKCICNIQRQVYKKARWPSGLRRSIKENILYLQKNLLSSGVGSNPTLVTNLFFVSSLWYISNFDNGQKDYFFLLKFVVKARRKGREEPPKGQIGNRKVYAQKR